MASLSSYRPNIDPEHHTQRDNIKFHTPAYKGMQFKQIPTLGEQYCTPIPKTRSHKYKQTKTRVFKLKKQNNARI